jgi:hypothetical protein
MTASAFSLPSDEGSSILRRKFILNSLPAQEFSLWGQTEKMGSREQITTLLNQFENDLKALEIAYEQYFLGTEKRLPEQQRQKIVLRMRKMITYYIPQTDLRFRLQGISSRFNSYCGYWDRIQRQIEEGRYERHTSRIQRYANTKLSAQDSAEPAPSASPIDSLYEKLVDAHQSCQLRPPNRDQVARFLAKQEETIKKRFGDRPVDFVVVTESGKPKIKVCAKQ